MSPGPRTALAVLCMAQFVLVLDIAIVNVALPSIQDDLGFSPERLQLVVTAYALTFGGLLLLGGRVADLLGRRRVFAGGFALFTFASLACGLATSSGVLVAARAAQGVGGALVSPAALALLLTTSAEGEQRNRALGVWSAVAAGGGAAGLLLGGVLTDLASWRWVFLVNVLVGVVVVPAAFRVLPPGELEGPRGHIDVGGAVAVTAGLIALVYGLGRGGEVGFADAGVVILLVSAGVLLTIFVAVELRVREPLVPFGLFRLRTLADANVATLLLSAVVIGANFFLTLYFQQVLGFSPLLTGLAFLPMTLASAASSWLSSRLVGRLGARMLLIAGMLCLAAGAALLSGVSPGGSYLRDALPGLLLVAAGLGPGFTVGTLAATAGVAEREQGVASGIFATSQQLGGALGLAVLVTVASAATGADGAQTQGFAAAFWLMAGLALAGALAVAGLVREPDSAPESSRRRAAPAALTGGTAHASPCQPAAAHIALARQTGGTP